MNKIEKSVLEQARGLNGFLVPAQVLPNELETYYGLRSSFKMVVTGELHEIEGQKFFRVESWELYKR